MEFNISYAITACTEIAEITRLVSLLQLHKDYNDEIVIVIDKDNYDPAILDFCNGYKGDNFKVELYSLNNDFAAYKNYLNSLCTKEYIFQLDADEYPSEFLLRYVNQLINDPLNSEIDLYYLPRINFVDGLTEAHVKKWNWNISLLHGRETAKALHPNDDEYKFLKSVGAIVTEIDIEDHKKLVKYCLPLVNFPDLQGRLFKNNKQIKWEGAVHERLVGFKNQGTFPFEESYSLYHIKSIDRQEKQNAYYETISR